MKKQIFLTIALISAFILSGCQNGIKENGQDGGNTTDVSEINEIDRNIDFGDITYNSNTDIQNYYQYFNEAVSYNIGYYIFENLKSGNRLLEYFDRQTGVILPVCSKADCKHEDESCDAVFSYEFDGYLSYYNGNLYTVFSEWNDDMTLTRTLYKISLDGSRREKLFDLSTLGASGEFQGVSGTEFKIHRGYVYYAYTDGDTSHLFVRKLDDDKEAVEICRCSGLYSLISDMMGYGDGIMFQTYTYNDADGADVCGKIIYYNQGSGQLSLIFEGNLGSFAIYDNGIVYFDGKDIKMLDLSDYESEVLAEECRGYPSYDGKYIYVDNIWECECEDDLSKRKIDVYDMAGRLVDSISLPDNSWETGFGDEYYLFQRFDEGEMYAFDKSQIGTGSYEWTLLDGV